MRLRTPLRRAAARPLLIAFAVGALALLPAASRGDAGRELAAAGGQVTGVGQWHPALHSPYATPDVSFGPGATYGWSLTTTLFLAVAPWPGGALVVMPEYANGRGMPNPSGLGGYVDGDIVRVPSLGSSPYLARAYYQHVLALSSELAAGSEESDPEARFMPAGPAGLAGPKPASRVELTVGKFGANDFFDLADVSSDPHHRFMNWSLMNEGAWDYAADVRGYTFGAVAALETPRYAVRAGVAMMPTRANGPDLDGDLLHAHSEIVEGEVRYAIRDAPGSAKLLLYWNHARMGSYAEALASRAPGAVPEVAATRRAGALKYGVGLLVQQQLGPAMEAFIRAGANDGATETFAFTEIDRSVSGGVEVGGRAWGRRDDRVGVAVAGNGLSRAHTDYLAAGGRGFQLGDGALRYAWEVVAESYYAWAVVKLLRVDLDLQGIVNPGMNADRGPAFVAGVRLHAHL
jgi:high affinity Mn2+ porin